MFQLKIFERGNEGLVSAENVENLETFLVEVILEPYRTPNPVYGQRDCCFWKAILDAKCPVKIQNSSQTKDLIKDYFSFKAFFTTTAVYGTLGGFTAPLSLP